MLLQSAGIEEVLLSNLAARDKIEYVIFSKYYGIFPINFHGFIARNKAETGAP
jgi:hypothetical protein